MSGIQPRGGKAKGDFFIITGQFNNVAAGVSTQVNAPGTSLELSTGTIRLRPGFKHILLGFSLNVLLNDLDVTGKLRLALQGLSSAQWPEHIIPNGTTGLIAGPTFNISQDETQGFDWRLDTSASATGNITLACWVVVQRVVD